MEITKRTCLSAGEPVQIVLSAGLKGEVNTISPVRVPMDEHRPFIIYDVSGETDTTDKQRNAIDTCTVELGIFAESYGQCVDISEKIRELLSHQRITHTFEDGSVINIDCSRMTGFGDSMTDDGYYHRSITFSVKSI